MSPLNVVIAPDSFKGSLTAEEAGQAIARGWRSVRPDDSLTVIPMADGGEGTLDIVHRCLPASKKVPVGSVTGPDGRPTPSHYLETDPTTALIELAVSSGITLMGRPEPFHATTRGLGETMRQAISDGKTQLIVALGGSASTDAGMGALEALGLRLVAADGSPPPQGGGGLIAIESIVGDEIIRPPGGITVLRDTRATLLDAPRVFGPQKGATEGDISQLEEAFRHLLSLVGYSPCSDEPGSGAAGGTGWGLCHFLGAELVDGAEAVADLVGLTPLLSQADIVITGEGKFDATSLTGKVAGTVLELAHSRKIPAGIVAGVVDDVFSPGVSTASLEQASGSREAALSQPGRWAEQCGANLARSMTG
jgi:glycerate 2-kinase